MTNVIKFPSCEEPDDFLEDWAVPLEGSELRSDQLPAIEFYKPRDPIKPRAGVTTDEYCGGCPLCGKNDGYLNAGKSHWFVCDEHQTIWFGGINLFSC